jgi:hypothetical protein
MALATKIIATRRLQLHVKPLKGFTSPATDRSWAMPFHSHSRYRGRSSSSELQPFGFPSTLVLLKTRFRVVVLYSLVKEPRGLLRPPTEAAKRDLEAFVSMRRRDSVFCGGA